MKGFNCDLMRNDTPSAIMGPTPPPSPWIRALAVFLVVFVLTWLGALAVLMFAAARWLWWNC